MTTIIQDLQKRKEQLTLELKQYPSKQVIDNVAGTQLKFDYYMLNEEVKYIDGQLKVLLTPIAENPQD